MRGEREREKYARCAFENTRDKGGGLLPVVATLPGGGERAGYIG